MLLAFNVPDSSGGGSIASSSSGAPEPQSRSLPQLMEQLGLPDDPLKRALHSLACGKFKVLYFAIK